MQKFSHGGSFFALAGRDQKKKRGKKEKQHVIVESIELAPGPWFKQRRGQGTNSKHA
jgi:hypothetical protein